jgi:hypothetical protein
MKIHSFLSAGALCLTAAFASPAHAVNITIEPDNYTGDISNVAPGAKLSTFRRDFNAASGYAFHPVYSILGGTWTPTGTRVFGHRKNLASETIHHWDYASGAYYCEQDPLDCTQNFYVLRVDFRTPTTRVEILTTQRGEQAMDPIELVAFNAAGQRLLRCQVSPVTNTVLATGVMPPPKYLGSGTVCGAVLEKKNCSGADPGNCDYVIKARVLRRQADIAYVMFAGPLFQNTWAPADKLSYELL